jgi:hypothetical protein
MEQKEIGTVEPIGGVNLINFIYGAIDKYGSKIEYHNSLIEYIRLNIESQLFPNGIEK